MIARDLARPNVAKCLMELFSSKTDRIAEASGLRWSHRLFLILLFAKRRIPRVFLVFVCFFFSFREAMNTSPFATRLHRFAALSQLSYAKKKREEKENIQENQAKPPGPRWAPTWWPETNRNICDSH